MKPLLKISLSVLGLLVLSFAVAPLIPKQEINKGLITKAWTVPAHNDVRLRSPGVWEQAWLPTQYFMELQDVNTKKLRVVEIYEPMYWMYKDKILTFVELGDSVKYHKDKAKAEKEVARTREVDSVNFLRLRK